MSRPAGGRHGKEGNAIHHLVNAELGPALVGKGERVAVVQQIEGTPSAAWSTPSSARPSWEKASESPWSSK